MNDHTNYRSYYLRSDGSATPNKPWSGDHVMTVRARSVKEAETRLRYLVPDEVYVQISVPSRACRILLCASWSLRGKGLNEHLFVGDTRRGSRGIEILEVPLYRLASEIIRITEAFVHSWGAEVLVEFFDGTIAYPGQDGRFEEAEEEWESDFARTGTENFGAGGLGIHRQIMRAAYMDLNSGLLSPRVRLIGPKPCRREWRLEK